MHRRALVAAVVLASTLAFPPAATATLCGEWETPIEALAADRVVFVGVVDSVSNLDRWAVVHVQEVWSRGSSPEWVEVRGTDIEPQFWDVFGIFANISSADKSYRPGDRYLFSLEAQDGHLFDWFRSATVRWNQSLEAARPVTAHPPIPDAIPPSGIWLIVILAGMLAGGSAVLVVLRRKANR